MANSSITLQFSSIPQYGENVSFNEQKNGLTLVETFFNPSETDVAFRYQSNLIANYNGSNLFTITLTDNYNRGGLGTVTVTANYSDAVFLINNMPSSILATVNNQATIIPPVVIPPVIVDPVVPPVVVPPVTTPVVIPLVVWNIPYFYISKSNSLRFASRVTFRDSFNYKTDENTLSSEVDSNIAYAEIQQFQSSDIITTQFKSNYTSNVATIVKSDKSEVNIPIVKKTSNMGIADYRSASKYNIGNGKTGVYFNSLNGSLPEWGIIGNYIIDGSTSFLIEEIAYNEEKNAYVLVYSSSYAGPLADVMVGSIFNRFNYEVYEFAIDMVNYIDQYFQVRINNTDPNFSEVIHLSEQIWCKVKHEKVLEIKYSNSTNTDMFYATGIENLIRIPYYLIKGKSDEESEVHKTDTTSILLNADIYEVDDFVFEPVTKELWRKLMQALSHEKVTINGVSYVKNGNFNTDGPLEESNLYVLTATMIKTANVYISQTSGGLDFNGTEVEVPALITTETGFVSY